MAATQTKQDKLARTTTVLTLTEAASHLRVSESALADLAAAGGVPARKIGDEWRFLRTALDDWLGCLDRPAPRPGSKQAVLAHYGIFRDDDDLEERLADARARRKAGG